MLKRNRCEIIRDFSSFLYFVFMIRCLSYHITYLDIPEKRLNTLIELEIFDDIQVTMEMF